MSNNLVTWAEIKEVSWVPVLQNTLTLKSQYKVMPTEGYIAWEYNPLRNYRLSLNMYEKNGKYYTESEFFLITKINKDTKDLPDGWTLHESGELIDFITNELSFNLEHPVDVLPQYSYDGSVNLILNDGLNIPRLINSRFTVTGKNTYKVIDRKGDNDTNIYDLGKQFDVDTSLFKNVNKIPLLTYLGTSNGNLKIGNYHFYFKYSDADGNESDWVAESGLVSVFIGETPLSVNTGIRDENSIKSVRFNLTNIDIGYCYVKVYYTRYSADIDSNFIVEACRIEKNFLINSSGTCSILITGDENVTEVSLEEINSSFDVILNAQTQCSAANRLFMANIHKSKIEYDVLSKLSLCFCPYKSEEPYPIANDGISEKYTITSNSDGYYNSLYIYNKTGYWPGELYRLGVVYILKDGSLSPVFNIRGATDIHAKNRYYNPDTLTLGYYYKVDTELANGASLSDVLASIDYSEESYLITGGLAKNENAKGVIQLAEEVSSEGAFPVLGINITTNHQVIEELKKYVKGFFFVRLKRMPLTLCLGLIIGLDKESRTPTIPIESDELYIQTDKSFVETNNINSVNYVSEGFLSRYYYDIEKKPTDTGTRILRAVGIVAVIAAAVVVTVFTCGAGGAVIGAGLAAATTAGAIAGGAAAVAGAASAIGITMGAIVGVAVIGEAVAGGITAHRLNRNEKAAKEIKGREEPIPEGFIRKELEESRLLRHDFKSRVIIKDPTKNSPSAIIVPDYLVNLPYYNLFFTGENFTVRLNIEQPSTNFLIDGYLEKAERHFYISTYQSQSDTLATTVRLVGVPDGCPIKMIEEYKYCARAGYPEEAYKYEFIGKEYQDSVNKRDNSDIIRGYFGSFVGMQNYTGHAGDLINIMIPGYKETELFQYLLIRAQDTSAFYAISDRIDINAFNQSTSLLLQSDKEIHDFSLVYYRGDCYICLYSHRIIRNFNDPSAPYNDKIVDEKSWKDNYDPDNIENYANINLGDVNAVKLGMWTTFMVRSSYNLNIRTIDKSHIDELLMCGNYRSFYPHYGQLADGNLKIPDSDLYNKGFSKSVSEKYYFEVPDIPYIKQEFQNRIVFSDIHINDAYKNGFRVLRTMNHKDYPMTYGSITKLVELKNALMIIFEHGIGLVNINNSAEHPSQILSDLNIISDTYGSQWKDSIIKTPSGVYGVDTVAKKIWRVKEGQIELISDMKVQEFLNQNISLSERELIPLIGIRNVKTIYNAFKHDIMFTFYDNLQGVHEKSWNLCWNEILGIFTTFYSWIPSTIENIDNIPFSFNRDTVKAIAKLGVGNHGNDFSDGITLTNNVLNVNIDGTFTVNNKDLHLHYLDTQGELLEYSFKNLPDDEKFIGFLHLDNRILLDGKTNYYITYELLRDNQGNHLLFEIVTKDVEVFPVKELLKDALTNSVKVSYLRLKDSALDLISELYYRNKAGHSYPDVSENKIKPTDSEYLLNLPIFKNTAGKRLMLSKEDQINPSKIVRYLNIKANIYINSANSNKTAADAYYELFANGNKVVGMIDAGYFESQVAVTTDHNLSLLSTDFWKHGQAGLVDISDKIYPTYWYGLQHPFEFECVVVDNPSVHKIFTNLELVANKVKPESFHYEVVGDTYDFSDDKPTMYFRQEALKALYLYNGYDIEYNSNFLEIEPKQHNKSADFPKYYSRWDTVNEIYDSYKRFQAPLGFNYDHLSGAEIIYYPTRNEFRVWNHVEAIDVNSLNQEIATSVIKANCRYLEDKWLITINPIVVTYKNEFDKLSASDKGESIFKLEQYGIYKYTTWVNRGGSSSKLPPINIQGTKLETVVGHSNIQFPQNENGKDNALYGLYDLALWNQGSWSPIDPTKNKDRRETDVRGKFMKVRIRYSGEELAIIDFLNTLYEISYA